MTDDKKKILVVDDEENIVSVLRDALSPNYDVVSAADGEEAFNMLLEMDDIDLVFADLKMPKIDGVELTRKAKEKGIKSNFVVISGFPSAYSSAEAIAAGAVDYLPKPLDMLHILKLAEKWAGGTDNPQEDKKPNNKSLEARVLIVDDEAAERNRMRGVLELEGYKVDEAATGEEALTKLIDNNYDVAIIDMILPTNINGMDLLHEIVKGGIQTKAILTSALINTENQRHAFKNGASDVIEKNAKFEEALRASVPEVVDEKQGWEDYIKKIEERTGETGLSKKVHDEQYYTALGSGGRRKEEISREEALRRVLMDKILILHDNDQKRAELEDRLKRNYNIVTARNLSEAKTILPDEVDIIMIDALLDKTYKPEEEMGFELAKELKSAYPKIPVVLTNDDKKLDSYGLSEKSAKLGFEAYLQISDDLEKKLNELIAKEKKKPARKIVKRRGPYVLVLVGPTTSGKTTTALGVENLLNERGEETVYIGNIKTGKPRKEKHLEQRDVYITEKEADRLEKNPNFTGYNFLGRRYFSNDSEILKALKEGKNIILVRNVEGLKIAGELVYRNMDQIPVKLISYRLHTGEDVLRGRLDARVDEAKSITPEEHQEREETLVKTIVEHASAPCDRVVSTSMPKEKTQQEVIGFMEWVDEHYPNLHLEFSNYARDIMRKLTSDRYFTRKEFEKELAKAPVVIEIESKTLPKVEIVKAEGHNGIYTFYLNPFYSKENLAPKQEFLRYVENMLGEKGGASNPLYEPDPVSGYAKTKVSYLNNRPIRLDDIVVFTLRKGISAEFAGSEYHTVAFVCLENRPKKESDIKITEI